MSNFKRKFERQNNMANHLVGPNGIPMIGSAPQPQSPFLDIKQGEDGPAFRLPVVAIGFIQPEILAHLAEQIANIVVERVVQVAAQASEKIAE
jgi:hypothetical protein